MKILQLRFKNLNSLSGEWSIDFTAPEYVSDGIFAISGPTGAGKSTIMDAICLALYGRTPRLNLISGSSNEIMSRHTGECFSEVVFETQKGMFRCTWSQHRARKKANGELQQPNREIVDALTGKILESKRTDVGNAIVACTGMDFDRFTQSMLLAQGGFAAFLQAKTDDRSEILQEITGTEIYAEISKLVHVRKSTENKNLDLLKAEISGIVILNQEEEDLINQELIEKQKIEQELAIKKAEIDTSIQWLKEMDLIKKDLASIATNILTHKQALADFENERLKLDRANRASEIEGQYATFSANKNLQIKELSNLNESKLKVPELRINLDLITQKHTEAYNSLKQINLELSKEQGVINRVREMDILIREKRTSLTRDQLEHQGILARKISKSQEKRRLQSSNSGIQQKNLSIEKYLVEHEIDAKLVSELTGIKVQLKNLEGIKDSIAKINLELDTVKKKFEIKSQDFARSGALKDQILKGHQAIISKQSANRDALKLLLGVRPLAEFRNDLTAQMKELAYLRTIASLEEERTRLIDNQPCPLCGSIHHPFANGIVPVPNETEKRISETSSLIEKAETLDQEYQGLTLQERKMAEELILAIQKLQQEQYEKDTLALAVGQKQSDLQIVSENYSGLLKVVAEIIQPFGISDIKETKPEEIMTLLEQKLMDWQNHQQLKATLGDQINQLSNEIESINGQIKMTGSSLKTKMLEIIALRKDLTILTQERINLYAEKIPDEEEIRMQKLKSNAEKTERESGDAKTKLGLELLGLNNRISELELSTSARKPQLDKEAETFNDSLHLSGFENEADFIACRLSKELRDDLSNKTSLLDTKQTELVTQKKDREDRLVSEEAKNMTQMPIDELTDQQQITNGKLSSTIEEIGARRNKIAENSNARMRLGKKTVLIEQQKIECKKWDDLCDLIGSSDGRKYRNFAQGLTFEIMIAHANRQLMKLTDRYLLVRDKNQPLDLNVIDNYQAGEERTTKNLSGGESFIVSLALALGLSKMASKNVRVDSLFLDEGFGSLDEDTLETALETLASLRQDGKLIGVISHVPALKERIGTKITVEKGAGGKSTIVGPGCKQNV